jgi:cystathionine beta-lyase/cystathionine gamma-synthase
MFLFLFRWFGLRHQQIHDIKAVDDLVRRTNQNTFVVVASTVATPLYQRPIKLTADIVLYSLTYLLMDILMLLWVH